MTNFEKMCKEIESDIEVAYKGITLEDAQSVAIKLLKAEMLVSEELKSADLDARMRKSGLKAVKASVYMEAAAKGDKKPTEAMLTAIVDSHQLVNQEQEALDKAEVLKAELERYYDIFNNAQVTFRSIAKGSFGG